MIQNRDYDSDSYITYIKKTKNIKTVNRFDILMDKYGDAGKVRYGLEGAFNVALGKITPKLSNMQEYLRSYFEDEGIYNYLHNSCMASTRASLNQNSLRNLYILLPPESVLNDYQNKIHPIRQQILQNKDEIIKLTKLRDWLLPILMNGQATVE